MLRASNRVKMSAANDNNDRESGENGESCSGLADNGERRKKMVNAAKA